MQPDKQLIQQRFLQARRRYDHHSRIQRQVAERLLELAACSQLQPETVLEIGCCTGILTRRLLSRFPSIRNLTINDMVNELVAQVQEEHTPGETLIIPLPGDIESIELSEKYDLIISSSTLHWLHNLDNLFTKIASHLQPGGILAFSMYGRENLLEIRKLTEIGLDYPSMETLQDMLDSRFELLQLHQEIKTLTFTTPEAVLQHLRDTGVNALDPTPWTKGQLQKFTDHYYRSFACENGVTLTYHPLYLTGRLRS